MRADPDVGVAAAAHTTARARAFALDDALSALGVGPDDARVVSEAVRRLMDALPQNEVEAFVQLRWHSRCHRQSIVEAAASIVGAGA